MKSIIFVALVIAAVAVGAPVDEPIKTLRSQFDQSPDGGYTSSFETENGINRQETGEVKEVPDEENKPHKVVVVRGSFSYKNDQGQTETIEYYADETGFHAEGASVPKGPTRR